MSGSFCVPEPYFVDLLLQTRVMIQRVVKPVDGIHTHNFSP